MPSSSSPFSTNENVRVFDKIFYLHQIGSVQAIAEPIQFQLHHTTSYINIDVHFSSCQVLPTLALLAQFYFTLRQVGPSVIITLGHRAPSCATWCTIGPYQIHWRTCKLIILVCAYKVYAK